MTLNDLNDKMTHPPATDSLNLAYIFLMLTLGINFFCFIYVTYIDRSRKRNSAATNGKNKVFRLSSRIWVPYLLLILLLLLFYLVFRS